MSYCGKQYSLSIIYHIRGPRSELEDYRLDLKPHQVSMEDAGCHRFVSHFYHLYLYWEFACGRHFLLQKSLGKYNKPSCKLGLDPYIWCGYLSVENIPIILGVKWISRIHKGWGWPSVGTPHLGVNGTLTRTRRGSKIPEFPSRRSGCNQTVLD